jgi:hypothetical protein
MGKMQRNVESENMNIGDHLDDVATIRRMMLKLILTKLLMMVWIALNWPVTVTDSCEHGNELSGLLRGREFFDQLLAPHKGLFSMELVKATVSVRVIL